MPPDLKRLAAEVSAQHGIRVDSDDPIMAVVTLNRLMLESAVADAEERIRRVLREFNDGADRLQVHAGSTVAREVRHCLAAVRTELAKGVNAAGSRPAELVRAVNQRHSRAAHVRWILVGLFVALAFFAAGVGVGRVIR